jgi:hypothetical protein
MWPMTSNPQQWNAQKKTNKRTITLYIERDALVKLQYPEFGGHFFSIQAAKSLLCVLPSVSVTVGRSRKDSSGLLASV